MNHVRQPIPLPRDGQGASSHSTAPCGTRGSAHTRRTELLACLAFLACLALFAGGCSRAAATTPDATPTPAAEGTLYFGADGVTALHARDGTPQWHTILDPQRGSGVPALAGETLYVPVHDSIAALDTRRAACAGMPRCRCWCPMRARRS